jgi:hypothetical protein
MRQPQRRPRAVEGERGDRKMPVVLYGPAYSTYARTARLALEGRRHRL